MGSLAEDIRTAILFMPEHREKSQRSRSLHLDILLEDFRRQSDITPGALDLILMGYRFGSAFDVSVAEFFGDKKIKFSPDTLSDLWQILFAAVLTRDKTPTAALGAAGVEIARSLFGERTTGVTNAFVRKVDREKAVWLERFKSQPEMLLPSGLRNRWKERPDLLKRTAEQIFIRPESGIWAFDESAELKRFTSEDLRNSINGSTNTKFQAMDPGSWAFINWAADAIADSQGSYLDACAAPGGKLVAMHTLLKKRNAQANWKFYASDSKHPRLELMRENLNRWKLNDEVAVQLHSWGQSLEPDKNFNEKYSVILADLPCSGRGTFHTRPDLLGGNPFERLTELAGIQTSILGDLQKRLTPTGKLIVSICSVDPGEVKNISKVLAAEPSFESWKLEKRSSEGITAWIV